MTFILAEDEALKTLLTGMTVSDFNTAARPVAVYYSIPDAEVRQQTYPYVTIDLIDIRAANDRQHAGYLYDDDLSGTVTPVTGTTYAYYMPVAYDLIYQVSTWSRHPRHDRQILHQMLQLKFPSKYGKLAVPNDLGTVTVNRSMFLDELSKISMVEDNRRLFRNVFTVRVISEMAPATADYVSSSIVSSVRINTVTPSSIPSGYYTI